MGKKHNVWVDEQHIYHHIELDVSTIVVLGVFMLAALIEIARWVW